MDTNPFQSPRSSPEDDRRRPDQRSLGSVFEASFLGCFGLIAAAICVFVGIIAPAMIVQEAPESAGFMVAVFLFFAATTGLGARTLFLGARRAWRRESGPTTPATAPPPDDRQRAEPC